MFNRRALLKRLGMLGGGIYLGIGCSDAQAPSSQATGTASKTAPALQRAIRQHFNYLTIDDAVIEAFARDLTKHQGPFKLNTSPRPFTRFLASTDFFQNDGNETRSLHYVSYYDPYVSPCYNPFATA